MYNTLTPISGRYSLIGTSDHLNNQDVLYQTSLGPGQYQVNLDFGGPKYTMGRVIKHTSNEVKKGTNIAYNKSSIISQRAQSALYLSI